MIKKNKMRNKTFDLILSALGTALISVCSWMTIPGAVPFTLQTFAVYCVLCLFGAKIGLQSIIVYILIGSIGTAWFMLVHARANGPIGIATAFSWCVLPFVLPDVGKLVLAVFISERLRPLVQKINILMPILRSAFFLHIILTIPIDIVGHKDYNYLAS